MENDGGGGGKGEGPPSSPFGGGGCLTPPCILLYFFDLPIVPCATPSTPQSDHLDEDHCRGRRAPLTRCVPSPHRSPWHSGPAQGQLSLQVDPHQVHRAPSCLLPLPVPFHSTCYTCNILTPYSQGDGWCVVGSTCLLHLRCNGGLYHHGGRRRSCYHCSFLPFSAECETIQGGQITAYGKKGGRWLGQGCAIPQFHQQAICF